ncbi:MAG TPA: SAM-dependent methyltransferase [Deltaproteobacteria bacterium]|nr:SAM-dependent methyltransferase [Deltaproteobacteria bacterium]
MSFFQYGEALPDARREHPAAARNQAPILAVLRWVFPTEGLVLEVASGTGQHSAFFTDHLPGLTWQTSEYDPDTFGSIEGWRQASHPDRIRPPVRIDTTAAVWPVARADAMLCVNMLQVSPWAAALGLLAGAARTLAPGAPLVIYSPMSRGGVHISPGNRDFDGALKARNPALGVRDADALIAAATERGLVHEETLDMPANNTVLVFRRPQA